MRFLDANVLIRAMAGDHEEWSPACQALLLRIEAGLEEATTSESVVAEVAYVLEGANYSRSREWIASGLRAALFSPGMHVDRAFYERAMELYESLEVGIQDAMSASHVERMGLEGIYSYEADFDRMPWITRVEPREV